MFRKTGLGQQISILPGGAQPAADQSGARRGAIEDDATPDHERRLLELIDQASLTPNDWRTPQPAPGKGR